MMTAKKGNGTLESLIRGEKGERAADKRVYFLSEIAWDSDYFEQSEKENKTYNTLLNFLAEDKELTGIVLDGVLSRLDRPEFLNKELTYWASTFEECVAATGNIPNREHYEHMSKEQFKILDKRLGELREKLPDVKLVLNIFNDDVQYTATQLTHEVLTSAGGAKDQLATLRGGKEALVAKRNNLKVELKEVKDVRGKGDERYRINRSIRRVDKKLAAMLADEQAHGDQVVLYSRPKKVRPIHQWTQGDTVRGLYEQYKEICDKHNVELITKHSVLNFDGFKIEYAHSREGTWSPLMTRHKRFVNGTHGMAEAFEGLDAIVESGHHHHGKPQKTLQRLELSEPEVNFMQWGDYNAEVGTKNITLLSAAPFEDQVELRKYLSGDKAERMGGGLPIGSKNHHAIKRLTNGGVAGLSMLRKDADGEVHTEMAQMADFVDGSILNQPDIYNIVGWTSDEHIGAKESIPILRDGFLALYKLLMAENPIRVRGKPVRMVGFGSGGDTAETNCGYWPDKSHDARDPHELIAEYVIELSDFTKSKSSDKVDNVYKLALRFASDAASGSTQSLRAIKDQVADFYGRFLKLTLENSTLIQAHVSVPGNHGDSKQRTTAEKETDHFVRDVKKDGVGVYEIGVKRPPKDARVWIGGGDYAHVCFVPDYGASTEGEPLFGPIRMHVQHDPVSGEKGLDGAGSTITADLEVAGHTHEHYVKMVNAGDNKCRYSYRFGNINGVDPTQVRYAQSVPRTQAAHAFTMPKKGQMIEFTFPGHLLKRIGEAQLYQEIKEEVNK